MKKYSRHNSRSYSEHQLAGLRASTAARKQETVERLRTAIESLKGKKQAITAQSVFLESGLHYSSYSRNPDAIELFRANSTHLIEKKKRTKHRHNTDDVSLPVPRNPLMAYKKPQLVTRLQDAMQRIKELERQQAVLTDACLQRDAQVVELKVRLAELEPYRSFIDQFRKRVYQEEHDT